MPTEARRKNNMTNTVKIGMMPGILNEYALEGGTTVAQALEIAGLNAEGFEVKADGNTVTNLDAPIEAANVILLSKKIKGNSNTIKIGVMPGILNEYALDESTTVAEALQIANLSAEGFEAKADGTTVTDFNAPIGNANVILLTKRVKGNDK